MKYLLLVFILITLNANENTDSFNSSQDISNANYERGFEYYMKITEEKTANALKAIEYFEKACDEQYYKGCSTIGLIYYYGLGLKQDNTKAKAYFAKACIGKNPMGCMYHKKIDAQYSAHK